MSEYKSGRVAVEGRTFLLKFWKNDSYFGLPFVSASEIITEKRKPHWWSRETRSVETKREIDSGWTHENRVETGMSMIREYLQREKEEIKERGDIEAVCSGINAEWL